MNQVENKKKPVLKDFSPPSLGQIPTTVSRFGWAMSFKELRAPFSPPSFNFSVVVLVRRKRRALSSLNPARTIETSRGTT